MLSIILPAYNEEQVIPITVVTLRKVLDNEIPYELVFVDDGSRDNTWDIICQHAEQDAHVSGIHFSRNFGKESAMFAGLEYATGDCCVIMDCDLQHPPEVILEMYQLWRQGYEVVEGIKAERGDESRTHKVAAGLFYRMISKATGIDMNGSSDFKLLDRKVVDTLNSIPERNIFFRALSYWVGYRRTSVTYDVQKRVAGESKWSTSSLVRYALVNITSFSTAPLQIITALGCLTLLFSFILGGISLYQRIRGVALGGFTTIILIQLFTSSVLMISMGIIGIYISKIYHECQGRPRYVVAMTCGRKYESKSHHDMC